MANELQLPTKYYDLQESQRRDFRDYMANQAEMGANISNGLEQVQNSVNAQTVAMVASQAALAQTFNQGFSGISNQLGSMGVSFSMGLDRVSNSLNRLSQDICNRLDAIHDIVNNPLLTQSRELYRRAVVNYNKGFFEEALEDIKTSLEKSKTDYISWFLEGKIYSFGASKFSNVIDLDLAIAAFTNAAKYNDPDITESNEARLMAAEIYFYWGIAQYAKSNDLLRADKKAESAEMLMKARKAFEQSYQYSDNMLESLFNVARCKAIQSDVGGAIKDLETLVLKDRNYCIRFYADGDFSSIGAQFTALIKKLKNAAFITAKNDYDRINILLQELASLGETIQEKIPSSFSDDARPYFDILDDAKDFQRIISIWENVIADKKAKKAGAKTLVDLIGVSVNTVKLQEFIHNLGETAKVSRYDNSYHYCYKSKGIELLFHNDNTLSCIFLFSGGSEGYSQYSHTLLPYDLTFNDTLQTIESKLGNPTIFKSRLSDDAYVWQEKRIRITFRDKPGSSMSKIDIITIINDEIIADYLQEDQQRQQEEWQDQGLCRFCGGELGGLLTKKCKSCGQKN